MKRHWSVNVLLPALAVVLVAFAWQQGAWTTPPAMAHSAEGRADCLMCHKAGAMEPVPDAPASHAEYTNDVCMLCHAPDAVVQTTAPPIIQHSLEGRDDCMMCHKPGAMEPVPDAPAWHENFDMQWCMLCHTTA
jgi:predicted CxxxxCH...CXXCH cytochrome family protein